MWEAILRFLGGSPLAPHIVTPRAAIAGAQVPAVTVDERGAKLWHVDVPHPRIEWADVEQIAVDVLTYGDGSAEGFWDLSGHGQSWGAPVEILAGSEKLNARLFAYPGFDNAAYRRAREAETAGQEGYFVCWRDEEA